MSVPDAEQPAPLGTLDAVPGAESIRRLSAIDAVRARILLAIEHGLLAPGERLPSMPALASGLDVSEITVRRALATLVDDGLLVTRRGRGGGTFVTLDPPQVHDSAVSAYRADEQAIRLLIDQRGLMEGAIAATAADTADAAECDELERLLLEAEAATNWSDFHRADRAFHLRCAEISRLPEAPGYVAVYRTLTRYFLPYPVERLRGTHAEHRRLVQAIRDRDARSAAEVARAHVSSLHRDMFIGLPRGTEGRPTAPAVESAP